jgi:hypothetical protein
LSPHVLVASAMLLGAASAASDDSIPAGVVSSWQTSAYDQPLVGPPAPPVAVPRGTRVQLGVEGAPRRWITGRLVVSDADALIVATGKGTERLARERLFHVSYSTASLRDRGKGAKIGAAITGLAGVVAGIVLVERETDGQPCAGCGLVVGLVGLAAAAPGGAIGYAIGAPSRDWKIVRPDGIAVAGRSRARGAAFALNVRVP